MSITGSEGSAGDGAAALASDLDLGELRGRIGWICNTLRIAALAYAAWVLYVLVTYWTDRAAITGGYGRMLRADLSGMASWQQGAALGVDLVVWLLAAAACFSAWRLFSTYLAGHIFTVAAARWMRRVAVFGLAAQLLGIATRPLISCIITAHLPADQHVVRFFFQPQDLLTLVLLASLLALAHIQKTGAEIAGEHAQIV